MFNKDARQSSAQLGRGKEVNLKAVNKACHPGVIDMRLNLQQELQCCAQEDTIATTRVHKPAVAGGPVHHPQQLLYDRLGCVEGRRVVQLLHGFLQRTSWK